MATPTSIRFEPQVSRRLASYVSRHPGATRSAVAARYVDEGLRMDEHPGVVFRDGPAGRRAVVVGGPDVWQVVQAVQAGRTGEPELSDDRLLEMVEANTGVPLRMIKTALDYWSAYPDEVDAMVSHAAQAEREHLVAAERVTTLLSR